MSNLENSVPANDNENYAINYEKLSILSIRPEIVEMLKGILENRKNETDFASKSAILEKLLSTGEFDLSGELTPNDIEANQALAADFDEISKYLGQAMEDLNDRYHTLITEALTKNLSIQVTIKNKFGLPQGAIIKKVNSDGTYNVLLIDSSSDTPYNPEHTHVFTTSTVHLGDILSVKGD